MMIDQKKIARINPHCNDAPSNPTRPDLVLVSLLHLTQQHPRKTLHILTITHLLAIILIDVLLCLLLRLLILRRLIHKIILLFLFFFLFLLVALILVIINIFVSTQHNNLILTLLLRPPLLLQKLWQLLQVTKKPIDPLDKRKPRSLLLADSSADKPDERGFERRRRPGGVDCCRNLLPRDCDWGGRVMRQDLLEEENPITSLHLREWRQLWPSFSLLLNHRRRRR
ncbi:hypothetical protein DFH27DRAFT_566928 [Peziza echinospora]|nr:hypothetical protein DFH27DRAFT_566928 [Peziza echinospora]